MSLPNSFAERVLDLVERIPAGRVMAYSDIAEWLEEGGPRQVGRVMSRYGGGVPWWRVPRADGTPPPCHEGRALERYRAEGTPLRPGGARVDMARARWCPDPEAPEAPEAPDGPGGPDGPADPVDSAGP